MKSKSKMKETVQPTLKPVHDNAKRSSAQAARAASTGESAAQRSSDAVKEATITRSAGSKSGNTPEPLQKHVDQTSRAGTHSGRSIPDATLSAGSDGDLAATAYNGGTVNAQSAQPARPPMPIPQSSDVA